VYGRHRPLRVAPYGGDGDHARDEETFPVALDVGDDAPRATLLDHDGDEVTVPVDGRTSVLVFYRGDW
jgi:hypothetical protein